VQDAIARILERARVLETERVPLEQAGVRTLAETVVSPIDHPPWDNSGMDGYAVRAEDVRAASRQHPVVLRVVESVPAGGFATRAVGPGEAIGIMTGAPVPAGADSVIRVEHTMRTADGLIAIVNAMDAGRNVRARGEDLKRGAVALERGRVLRPAEIGLLATMGCAMVPVVRRPRVAILSTGDELVDLDGFAEVEAGRKIVNSNTYALAAAVTASGCVPEALGIARDEIGSLRDRLDRGMDADAVITTAGASVGEHDLVKDALEQMGMQVDFWRVQMRPGSPFSFGTIARQDREPLLVFGLPGNPVSAVVTFEVLVRPALRRMLGRRAVHSRTITVHAAERIASKSGLAHFLRVVLESDGAGGWRARLTGPQGSGLLSSMAAADALLIVPLDVEEIAEGAPAPAIPLSADDAQESIGY
jgi:molybdopterin molybdotransferase